MTTERAVQRALISVSDKTGVVDFARALAGMGVEILSTGGTAAALKKNGIPVKDVADFTGFPEMLDGRVKTLHPKVHAGLLYLRDKEDHVKTMESGGLEPIDLVCVNLYPFEETVARAGVTREEAIENIDIGGPTMLRSAAKNMKFVTVVTDPDDYSAVLDEMKRNGGATTAALRVKLGQKVFARVAMYNAVIASYLAPYAEEGAVSPFIRACGQGTPLRYGENPHQQATLYLDSPTGEPLIAHTEVLHGKEMSYNNYVDGHAALEVAKEFAGQTAVSIIKHTNPCGFATGSTLSEALDAAWSGDPVSAFGSVIAVTVSVDLAAAEKLAGRFVEALIAPGFDADALDYLKNKSKHIRLLNLKQPMAKAAGGREIKEIGGGLLVQDRDAGTEETLTSVTEKVFPEKKMGLARFGISVCKHVKSNAILLVREYAPGFFSVLGMGAGQPNRVDAVRKLAITKARENIDLLYSEEKATGTPEEYEENILREAVLISDAFFPFPDNVENAALAGIHYIVEPGGSKRDDDVIACANQYGVALLFSGVRHFKH